MKKWQKVLLAMFTALLVGGGFLTTSFNEVDANVSCIVGSQTTCSVLLPQLSGNQVRGRVEGRTDTHHGVSARVEYFRAVRPGNITSGNWTSSSGNNVTAVSGFILNQGLTPNHSNFVTRGRTAVGM